MGTALRQWTNRLARETSPYLLQHAHNPVDWYPWSAEAFDRARAEGKPIFLSVGYSSCYWCHVMERQCFENQQIAALMNQHFVNIKVDREERPDVDQLYMTAVQLLTGQGGWPMSIFLMPDLRPFFGGTYFPPQDSHGRPGFGRLLAAVHDAWTNRRDKVQESAQEMTRLLQELARPQPVQRELRIDAAWVETMIRRSTADFDPAYGGFSSAPKFPRQPLLELLLMYLREHRDQELLQKLRMTLDAMAHGGIRDQLGGAFHRYSTDERWLVPHFEIMLYDNAMLLWIYAEAYQQTREARYGAVARSIADFVLTEMTSPQGAFYTALDAEVDGQEGASYLWTRQEADEILAGVADSSEVARFCRVYGLDQDPNFADPHAAGDAPQKYVLYLAEPFAGGRPALLDPGLAKMREALHAARRRRKQPRLDDKILTAWNGLMVRGLAHAGRVLAEPRYVQAAAGAADFLLARHRGDGGLLRLSTRGNAKLDALLEDYAFLIQGLLALDEAGDGAGRRGQAADLAGEMLRRFGSEDGGFFYTPQGAGELPVRQQLGSDSPLPSGNGVAAMVTLELGHQQVAQRTIAAFGEQLQNLGQGMSALVQAAMQFVRVAGVLEISPGKRAADRPAPLEELAARVLTARPQWTSASRLELHCSVQAGFHINAFDPGPGAAPTRLSLGRSDAAVEYPPPELRKFAFNDQPLRVYQGQFVIGVVFARPPSKGEKIDMTLSYQACDGNACLASLTRQISEIVP
jgi:uncharacterized protein YyaL (SSP411 family)